MSRQDKQNVDVYRILLQRTPWEQAYHSLETPHHVSYVVHIYFGFICVCVSHLCILDSYFTSVFVMTNTRRSKERNFFTLSITTLFKRNE